MTNHTPAPWVIDTDGDITHFIQSKQGEGFCVALGLGGEGINIQNAADRDLILAAPDMYEALLNIQAGLGAIGDTQSIVYRWARDALKKARGEV